MLFDFIADLKKTTAVPAPAHLFFHMHLLILGDTLTDGRWVIMLFLAKMPVGKNVMEKIGTNKKASVLIYLSIGISIYLSAIVL